MSLGIRTYGDLHGEDASGLGDQVAEQAARVERRLAGVDRVVAVTSGKGGVGKSLLSAALAVAASRRGLAVGLVDADLNGPTAARFLGAAREPLRVTEKGILPARTPPGVALMSSALLLDDEAPLRWREPGAHSFVWRGTQERGAFREFLSDVAWGARDLLLVDLPPGGQRLLDLGELVPGLAGAVAVTLPSEASRTSVARSLSLCRRRGIPILGVIENMSGVLCAECGAHGPLFSGDAGAGLARDFEVPLLGRIPFVASVSERAESGELGAVVEDAVTGQPYRDALRALRDRIDTGPPGGGARGADA